MTNRLDRNLIGTILLNQGHLDRIRVDCPNCGKRDLLTLTRDGDNILYNCYSNSCNTRGAHRIGSDLTTLRNKHQQEGVKSDRTAEFVPFRLPPYLVEGIASNKALDWLVKNNAVKAYEMGYYTIYTDPKEERICVPLYGVEGKLVNLCGRSYINAIPKNKIYNRGGISPPFVVGCGDRIVIVEDFASACNVATVSGYVGLALLGTHLNKELVLPVLNRLNPTSIKVALDKDAILKGIKIANLLNNIYNNVSVLPLTKDLKNFDNLTDKDL